MNEELDKKLCEKYPKLYKNRNASMHKSCLHWGFEHGDGWYQIIDALSMALTYGWSGSVEFEENEKPSDPTIWISFNWDTDVNIIADQVKEKFGTLRFYEHIELSKDLLEKLKPYPKSLNLLYNRINNYVSGAVALAEAMSSITCEQTGKPGVLCGRGGWMKTLCSEEAAKQGFEPYKRQD